MYNGRAETLVDGRAVDIESDVAFKEEGPLSDETKIFEECGTGKIPNTNGLGSRYECCLPTQG